MTDQFDFLYDTTEDTTTRFVCFITESLNRFDLAITNTNRFYGKKMVTNLQNGKTAIIGPDDLKEEGYVAYAFGLTDEEGEELQPFLEQIVGSVNFTDL